METDKKPNELAILLNRLGDEIDNCRFITGGNLEEREKAKETLQEITDFLCEETELLD